MGRGKEENQKMKRRKIFVDGKYLVSRGEEKLRRKKDENIWRLRIFCQGKRFRTEKEKERNM